MFKLILKLKALCYKIIASTIFRFKFKKWGKGAIIALPIKLRNEQFISIGEKVYIDPYSWLYAENQDSQLIIGKGSQIGRFFHCVSMKSVEIGSNVLIAERVLITDCNHCYENVEKPILDQGIIHINPVKVGAGSWIGEGACLVGCTIGENCVIAANAVVTKDIPNYSVVAGNPAKIIKKYNHYSEKWEKINE